MLGNQSNFSNTSHMVQIPQMTLDLILYGTIFYSVIFVVGVIGIYLLFILVQSKRIWVEMEKYFLGTRWYLEFNHCLIFFREFSSHLCIDERKGIAKFYQLLTSKFVSCRFICTNYLRAIRWVFFLILMHFEFGNKCDFFFENKRNSWFVR